jgi:hypothetical protein
MNALVKEDWDKTWFYLLTLSSVFIIGLFIRLIAG